MIDVCACSCMRENRKYCKVKCIVHGAGKKQACFVEYVFINVVYYLILFMVAS